MTHPIKSELISHGEKVDMHEKQPNRNIEKVEYLDENVVNEKLRPAVNKTSISFITDKKLSHNVSLLVLFFLRIQQSLVNKMFSFHAKTANRSTPLQS